MSQTKTEEEPGSSELSEKARFASDDVYESVVILGSIHYKEILNKLSGPQVKVIAEEQLTPDSIIEVVKREKRSSFGRTLWMLTTGIYSICDGNSHPDCKSCQQPLHYLYTSSQLSESEIADEVQDILFHTNKVCTLIQDELGPSGTIVIVPPIPAVIVQDAAFQDHGKLHKTCQTYFTSCASDVVLFRLHIFYNILCDAWSSLATDWLPFGEQALFREFQSFYRGRNLVSIKTEENYSYVEQGWITMVHKLIKNVVLSTLSKDTQEIVQKTDENISLTESFGSRSGVDESVEESDSEPGTYKHCVIVGSSSFFGHLKDMVKGMPVSFLDRPIDLDQEGLDILKEESDNYPDNTIWIIVRGVSEIAELTDESPRCKAEKCEDPLYVFVLKNKLGGHPDFKEFSVSEMIDKVLSRAVDFGVHTLQYLKKTSHVFIVPIIPVSAYFGGNNSAFSHEKLHEIADSDPSTPILAGSCKEWISAVQELDQKWMKMIMNNVDENSAVCDILKNQIKGLSNLLIFTSVPGKNTRLLKTQTIWGNIVKGLISVLLGFKDIKKKKAAPSSSSTHRPPTTAGLLAVLERQPDCPMSWGEPSLPDVPTVENVPTVEKKAEKKIATDAVPAKGPPSHSKDLDSCTNTGSEFFPAATNEVMNQRFATPIPGLMDQQSYSENSYNYAGAGPGAFMQQSPFAQPGNPSFQYPYNYQVMNPPPFSVTPEVVNQSISPAYPKRNQMQNNANIRKNVKGNQAKNSTPNPPGPSKKQVGSLGSQSNDATKPENRQIMSYVDKSGDVALCKIIVTNMNPNIRKEHVKQILEACGSVVTLDFLLNKGGGRADKPFQSSIKAQYNNAKSAKRAARVINFLKVFGKNSAAHVIGLKQDAGTVWEFQSEDRLIIPIIQDVIVQMQKAKAPSTQVSIVAQKQFVPKMVIAETEKPKEDVKLSASTEIKGKSSVKTLDPKKPIINVVVSNLSKYVSADAIKEITKTLGSVTEGDVKEGQFVCQLQDVADAIRMVIYMNNFRLPDQKLKVYPQESLDFKSAHVKPEEELSDQINMIYKKYTDDIVNNLREGISKDVNYYTYKTQLCKSFKCKDQAMCHNYHNIKDRRRSPLTSDYSSTGCVTIGLGQCKLREGCSLSHTSLERKFHRDNFRGSLCSGAVKKGVCCYHDGICASAHPETAEMFFHTSWENLYVEGLGETLKFLNGAIKNMFKLSNTTDLQVLVLTSTFEMVQLLMKTVLHIAKSCKQSVVSVSQYGSVASDGTVMISTPTSLVKLLKRREQKYDFTKIKAIIIDDGLKVFTEIMNSKDDKLDSLLASPDANKVVVDDKVSDGKVGVAANVMKASFKKLLIDRPKQGWEPFGNIDANTSEQDKSPARPSVPEEKKDSPALKKSLAVFKVPSLPVSRPRTKEISTVSKFKDSNLEKTENPADTSRPEGKTPLATNDKNQDTEKPKSALKLLMTSYQDFHKSGKNTEPSSGVSQSMESSKPKEKQWASEKNPTSKSTTFPKLNTNLVPYFSLSDSYKSYASIPFNYDESIKAKSKEESKARSSGNDNRSSSPSSRKDEKSRRSPGKKSPKRSRSRDKSPTRKDSRRSPTSTRSSRRSPQPSSRDSYSRKRRSPSPPSRSRYDDKKSYNDKKSFIEAEMDLKQDHIKESKLFLDVPEVHPKFESKYKIFSERYEKQYPGKSDNSHKEQRWQEFWKVVVTGMQEAEWKEKIDMLKRQVRISETGREERKDSKASSKRKKRDSREKSNGGKKSLKRDDDDELDSRSSKATRSYQREDRRSPSDRRGRSSLAERSPPPSRRDHSGQETLKDSEGQLKSSKYLEEFSVSHALNAIGEVCHLLGVLNPAMKIVIDRISKSGVDSKESISIITENDNALLIEMCHKRFESLTKTYPRGPERKQLIEAAAQAKKLQEYAALRLQEIAMAAADNAISVHRGPENVFKASPEVSSKASPEVSHKVVKPKLIHGIDVNKISRATHEKGTEATIEFIKNAFAYEGVINPTEKNINEIYIEVSRIHFKMTLDGFTSDSERRGSENSTSSEVVQNIPLSQSGPLYGDNNYLSFPPGLSSREDSVPSFPYPPPSRDNRVPSFPHPPPSRDDSGPSFPHPPPSRDDSGPSFPHPPPSRDDSGPSFPCGPPSRDDGPYFPYGPSSRDDSDPLPRGMPSRDASGPSFSHGLRSRDVSDPSFSFGPSSRDECVSSFPRGLPSREGRGSPFLHDTSPGGGNSLFQQSSLSGNSGGWTLPPDSILRKKSGSSMPYSSSSGSDNRSSFKDDNSPFPPDSSVIENRSSSFPPRSLRESTGPSFPSSSSLRDTPSFSPGFVQRDSSGPTFSQGSRADDVGDSYNVDLRLRGNRSPLSYQHQDYVDREENNQSGGARDTLGNFRNSENQYKQWAKQGSDSGTIDFMNKRLDLLLQDTRYKYSNTDKDQSQSEEQHNYENRDDRQYSRDDYGMRQQHDDDSDDDQRNIHFDRGNDPQSNRQYDRNEQYDDSGPWSKDDDGKYGEKPRSDLRSFLNRCIDEDNDSEIDIDSMRHRTPGRHPRVAPGNEWGPSGQAMQPKNEPDLPSNASDQERRPGSLSLATTDAGSIQAFLNRFR